MPDPALRRILRLVAARSLNTFGRAVITATVYWDLYDRTDNTLVLAAVGFVQVIPVVLLFVPAGTLVDRSDRRKLSSIAASTTGFIGVGLALASYFGAPVAVYLALLLGQGCVNVIHAPASSSLIPLIIPREDLVRTNRIGASLQELSAITGPALAGLALTWIWPHWIYAAVAITGIASGILYRSLPKPRVVEPSATVSARKDWRVGLRFIFRSPLLLPALTLDMVAVLFAGVPALLPAVARDILHIGPFGYGILRASQSAGAVVMALVGGRFPAWRRPGHVLLVVVTLFGAATIGFGLSTSFPLSVGLLFLCGALDNISVVIRLTLEQMVVPDEIRGRVAAVHYVFIGMSNELGGAESGLAAWLVGTVPAIVGGGAIAVAFTLLVAAKWRELVKMPPLAELKPP
ncbi:MAG: arabinose efflux permease family protein [Myxococcales bacterium]|nr:arabinose efflux permease family protein [Myxococcales bacterium]